jgi:hypothetical protein
MKMRAESLALRRLHLGDGSFRKSQFRDEVLMTAEIIVKPFLYVFDRFGIKLSFQLLIGGQMNRNRSHKPSALNRAEHGSALLAPVSTVLPSDLGEGDSCRLGCDEPRIF